MKDKVKTTKKDKEKNNPKQSKNTQKCKIYFSEAATETCSGK